MTLPDFPFAVGDKVRWNAWKPDVHVTVTAIGHKRFLALWHDGNEMTFIPDTDWERYIEPAKPRRWIVETVASVISGAPEAPCIALFGTATDNAWQVVMVPEGGYGQYILSVEPLDD